MDGMKRVSRIVLETTLKPFRKVSKRAIREVSHELFRQWDPLIRSAGESAVLLWVGDGSEILTYPGDLDAPFEWCRYVGFSNWQYPQAYEGEKSRELSKARLYTKRPPKMTYARLERIVSTLKDVGAKVTGKPVSVGATFDPAGEFAHSPFKYEHHNEIYQRGLEGRELKTQSVAAICAYARLNGDTTPYAGFPDGIPEGTPFGRFLGRQAQHFLSDVGFDYIWLSNGFGFSHFAWTGLGEAFNGEVFRPERARELAEQTLGFWKDFRAECPDFPVETRGTNFSTGMDLGSDGVPLEGIYSGGFNVDPPPNSPWGVLDGDFGLEMIGYMARMAQIPGDRFPFRYYTHDPWFYRSPWWDTYDREPYDIYCPLSVGRIDGDGEVRHPTSIEFLSVDHASGVYPERCAIEVIPHILMGIDHLPEAPGILTWIYPFSEYHQMTYADPSRIDEVYFGDWFMRNAVNDGLPLNTVVSSENFASSYGKDPSLYSETVLLTPVPSSGSPATGPLVDFVAEGGKALLYGPTLHADPDLLGRLNLSHAGAMSGELALEAEVDLDDLETGEYPARIYHREITSAGGMAEVLRDDDDPHVAVCASASDGDDRRIAALIRSLPEWKGGSLGWVRGTNAYGLESRPRLPVLDDPKTLFHGHSLVRALLARLGYRMSTGKEDLSVRNPLWFVSRVNNGFFFTGYVPRIGGKSRFRFPFGAPLLIGWETRLESGFSTYTFGRSYHEECRVFIEQEADTVVSCKEEASRNMDVRRRIRVSGLENATVRFYREADAMDCPVSIGEHTGGFARGRPDDVDYELEAGGRQLVARGVSGGIIFTW